MSTAHELVAVWGKPRTVGTLVMVSGDADEKLSAWGLKQLGGISQVDARRCALERIKKAGAGEATVLAALEVLEGLRTAADTESLLPLLESRYPLKIRIGAIHALGQLGPASGGRLAALLSSDPARRNLPQTATGRRPSEAG